MSLECREVAMKMQMRLAPLGQCMLHYARDQMRVIYSAHGWLWFNYQSACLTLIAPFPPLIPGAGLNRFSSIASRVCLAIPDQSLIVFIRDGSSIGRCTIAFDEFLLLHVKLLPHSTSCQSTHGYDSKEFLLLACRLWKFALEDYGYTTVLF